MTAAPLLFLILLFELRHHRWVGQGRGITQSLPVGDVTQQTAHALAATRLGKLGGKKNFIRTGDRTDLLRHTSFELVHQRCRSNEWKSYLLLKCQSERLQENLSRRDVNSAKKTIISPNLACFARGTFVPIPVSPIQAKISNMFG